MYTAFPPRHTGGIEIHLGQVGDPSRAVDDQVGLDHLGTSRRLEGDLVAAFSGFDRSDGGRAPQVDAGLVAALDQQFHKVRVETLQRALPAVDDGHRGIGPGGEVRELERDEAATDEHNPSRQDVQVEEVGAVDEVFVAGEVQGPGLAPVAIRNRSAS